MKNTGKSARIVFLSFADSRMKRAARRIAQQAQQMEVFDSIVVADEHALAGEDLRPWKHMFMPHVRGFGYWCWKPYLIEKVLRGLRQGDVLLYCDAGTHLNPQGIKRFQDYLLLLEQSALGVLAFDASQQESAPYLERQWNKRDTLRYFGCESRRDILDSPQVAATHVFCAAARKRCVLSSRGMLLGSMIFIWWMIVPLTRRMQRISVIIGMTKAFFHCSISFGGASTSVVGKVCRRLGIFEGISIVGYAGQRPSRAAAHASHILCIVCLLPSSCRATPLQITCL